MSMFKKAKYVGVISSLFCVGSLMAGPVPGSGQREGGGASGSGKVAPSPSNKAAGEWKSSGGSLETTPGQGRMSGNEQTVRTETRDGADGSKITTFKSLSGGSAELQTSAEGGLVSLEITDAGGVSTEVAATSNVDLFVISFVDGNVKGILRFDADGQVAQYTGTLGGQAAATYNVEIDGAKTTFTSAADSSNVFTVTANADGSLVVEMADGTGATVAASGAPESGALVGQLRGTLATQVGSATTLVSAVTAVNGAY